MTEKTTHLPSGETAGAPTRFISHSASWVSGCFAWGQAPARGAEKGGRDGGAGGDGRSFIEGSSITSNRRTGPPP